MMITWISRIPVVAQLAADKLDSDTPRVEPTSNAVTWIIVAVIVVAVLLIAFKGSKRNNMLEDQ
jgi:hypothetical protein